jgi:hypothetical protein
MAPSLPKCHQNIAGFYQFLIMSTHSRIYENQYCLPIVNKYVRIVGFVTYNVGFANLPTYLYKLKYDQRLTTLATTISNPFWQVLIRLVIHRVSREECKKLREGVPYVKIYRYNPKHLYPKLNCYGDNGQRKVWASLGSTHCSCQLTASACPSFSVESYYTSRSLSL